MEPKLFIFGMGFSANAIAQRAKGDFACICGTTRSHEKLMSLCDEGFEMFVFDGSSSPQIFQELQDITHLLITIAPGDEDKVLTAFPTLRENVPNLKWIGYLSTVGVYGNHDGAWVDEKTTPKPVSKRSLERIRAEEAWQEMAKTIDVPLAIFRLSGIYGPGRNAFTAIKKGTSRRLVKPGQVFNRIHREDIATAVTNAMAQNIDGIFNITDDEPAPPQDVVEFAHEIMDIAPPPEVDFETADLTPMARSFYGENKRVSNAKSKQALGMEYAYSNYRMALSRMFNEGAW